MNIRYLKESLLVVMDRYVQFLAENFPTPLEILLWEPIWLFWAGGCLWLAGILKRDRHLKTGYTRKIFHFLIFTSVTAIQAVWDIRMVCLFGAATSLVILYAVVRGSGNLLYEALAREKDAPHRTYYILAPYCATLIGGLTSNAFFGDAALVGYLVAGLGDAIGEPVGTRFGKHTYRVPALRGVPSTRSFEGSAAVLLMSALAVALAFAISPELTFRSKTILLIPGIALCSALLEAAAPHGWDNAILQIIPSWLVTYVLSQG